MTTTGRFPRIRCRPGFALLSAMRLAARRPGADRAQPARLHRRGHRVPQHERRRRPRGLERQGRGARPGNARRAGHRHVRAGDSRGAVPAQRRRRGSCRTPLTISPSRISPGSRPRVPGVRAPASRWRSSPATCRACRASSISRAAPTCTSACRSTTRRRIRPSRPRRGARHGVQAERIAARDARTS